MANEHWDTQKRIAKKLHRALRDELGAGDARLNKSVSAVARGFGYANAYQACHGKVRHDWRDERAAQDLVASGTAPDHTKALAGIAIVRARLGHLMA